MNRLLIVLVLIVAGVGGLGYYLGWFRIGSDSADGTTHVTLTVDEKKIEEDKKKAVKDVHEFEQPSKK